MKLTVLGVVVTAELQVLELAGGGIVGGVTGLSLGLGLHGGAHHSFQILRDLVSNIVCGGSGCSCGSGLVSVLDAVQSLDARFFIEKLKSIISKKVFEESATLPFSQNKAERYVQIRFLTNACVDTMVDYFKGNLNVTLDEVGEIIIGFLKQLKP